MSKIIGNKQCEHSIYEMFTYYNRTNPEPQPVGLIWTRRELDPAALGSSSSSDDDDCFYYFQK